MLDQQQREAFERDGYVVLGRIADASQVAELLEAERRHRPTIRTMGDGAPIGLLVTEQLCHRSAAVRRFCLDGAHVPAVIDVLGPNVAFTHTQFIAKLPDDVGADRGPSWIPLHQDDGYGRLDPPLDVTVWTALTDTDEDNGCLQIVPGSHLQGVLDHGRAEANRALREVHAAGPIPVPLPSGHAVLFTGLTVHGSGPNHADQIRVGMHARYCDPSVRMVTAGDKPVLEDMHSWMVAGDAP